MRERESNTLGAALLPSASSTGGSTHTHEDDILSFLTPALSTNFNRTATPGEDYDVIRFDDPIILPAYAPMINRPRYMYDLALLRLATPTRFTPPPLVGETRALCVVAGKEVISMGWGQAVRARWWLVHVGRPPHSPRQINHANAIDHYNNETESQHSSGWHADDRLPDCRPPCVPRCGRSAPECEFDQL